MGPTPTLWLDPPQWTTQTNVNTLTTSTAVDTSNVVNFFCVSLRLFTLENVHDIHQHRLSYFRHLYVNSHYAFDIELVYIPLRHTLKGRAFGSYQGVHSVGTSKKTNKGDRQSSRSTHNLGTDLKLRTSVFISEKR